MTEYAGSFAEGFRDYAPHTPYTAAMGTYARRYFDEPPGLREQIVKAPTARERVHPDARWLDLRGVGMVLVREGLLTGRPALTIAAAFYRSFHGSHVHPRQMRHLIEPRGNVDFRWGVSEKVISVSNSPEFPAIRALFHQDNPALAAHDLPVVLARLTMADGQAYVFTFADVIEAMQGAEGWVYYGKWEGRPVDGKNDITESVVVREVAPTFPIRVTLADIFPQTLLVVDGPSTSGPAFVKDSAGATDPFGLCERLGVRVSWLEDHLRWQAAS